MKSTAHPGVGVKLLTTHYRTRADKQNRGIRQYCLLHSNLPAQSTSFARRKIESYERNKQATYVFVKKFKGTRWVPSLRLSPTSLKPISERLPGDREPTSCFPVLPSPAGPSFWSPSSNKNASTSSPSKPIYQSFSTLKDNMNRNGGIGDSNRTTGRGWWRNFQLFACLDRYTVAQALSPTCHSCSHRKKGWMKIESFPPFLLTLAQKVFYVFVDIREGR